MQPVRLVETGQHVASTRVAIAGCADAAMGSAEGPLLAGLPTELLVLVVGCSDVPIRTYCQLIALTHILRAQLPPAMRELSFTKNVPETICDDDNCFSDSLPAAWVPSADAFACLVGPCTSLRHLEVGELDGVGDCEAPEPPAWIVRAFAACGASLVSLRLRGHPVLKSFRHLAAQLPNLQELSLDYQLGADWVRLCPQLRIIREGVSCPGSLEVDALALQALPHLSEIHLLSRWQGRLKAASEVLLHAGVSPHVRVFPRVCQLSVHAEGELTDAEATALCGTKPSADPVPTAALRVHCPRLQRVDWPCARPLSFDTATAASLAILNLRSFYCRVAFTAEELANNFGVLPNVRRLTLYATDLRAVCTLCADARVLPRLAALDVQVAGPRRDEAAPAQVRCKPSMRVLSIQCFYRCVDVAAPKLLYLCANCGVRLTECRALLRLFAMGSVHVAGECCADSPDWAGPCALRSLCFYSGARYTQHPGHLLAVLRRARATLTDTTLISDSSSAALDPASLAFACAELPRVRTLLLWGFRGTLPEVRLPQLRKLQVFGNPGAVISLTKPLQTPLLEALHLRTFTMGASSLPPVLLGAPANVVVNDVQLEQPGQPGDLGQWLALSRPLPWN